MTRSLCPLTRLTYVDLLFISSAVLEYEYKDRSVLLGLMIQDTCSHVYNSVCLDRFKLPKREDVRVSEDIPEFHSHPACRLLV